MTTLSTNLIKIENRYNDGFTSNTVVFVIDNNLRIKSVTFDSTSDNIDGSSEEFLVESTVFTLKFNPFIHGPQGLEGRYSLLVKSRWNPGEILASEGQIPKTTYFTYHGKFKNGL